MDEGRGVCLGGKLTAREVVGGLLTASHSLVDIDIATVHGAENAVLETAGILKLDVQLAVLAVLGDSNSRADGCDESIENEGESEDSQFV